MTFFLESKNNAMVCMHENPHGNQLTGMKQILHEKSGLKALVCSEVMFA